PFSNDATVKLAAVTAGGRKVSGTPAALSDGGLLRVNSGARVSLRANGSDYEGTVVKVADAKSDKQDLDEQFGTNAEPAPAPPPSSTEFLYLQTGVGTKVL